MPAITVKRTEGFVRPRLTVRGIFDRLAELNARHRTRRNLRALDAHLLRDIGLTRADVETELRRTLW